MQLKREFNNKYGTQKNLQTPDSKWDNASEITIQKVNANVKGQSNNCY